MQELLPVAKYSTRCKSDSTPRTTAPRFDVLGVERKPHALAFAVNRLDPPLLPKLMGNFHEVAFGNVIGPGHLGNRAQAGGPLGDNDE